MKVFKFDGGLKKFLVEASSTRVGGKALIPFFVSGALLLSGCVPLKEGLSATWTEEAFPAFEGSNSSSTEIEFIGDPTSDHKSAMGIEQRVWDYLIDENLGHPFKTPQRLPISLNIRVKSKLNEGLDIALSNQQLAAELYKWTAEESPNLQLAEQLWDGFLRGYKKAVESDAEESSACSSQVAEYFGQQALKKEKLEKPAGLICENIRKNWDYFFESMNQIDTLRESKIKHNYLSVIIDLSDSTYPSDLSESVSQIFSEVADGSYLSSRYSEKNNTTKFVSIDFISKNSEMTKQFIYDSSKTSQKIDEILSKKQIIFSDKESFWSEIKNFRSKLLVNPESCLDKNQANFEEVQILSKYKIQIDNELLKVLCDDFKKTNKLIQDVQIYIANPDVGKGSDIVGAVKKSFNHYQYQTTNNDFSHYELVLATDLIDPSIEIKNTGEANTQAEDCSTSKILNEFAAIAPINKFSVTLVGTGKTVFGKGITEKYVSFWTCIFTNLKADIYQTNQL